jgi:hypothetical protein
MAYKTLKFQTTPINVERVITLAVESIEIKEQNDSFFVIAYPTALDYNIGMNRFDRTVDFTEWKERAEEDRVGENRIVDILD